MTVDPPANIIYRQWDAPGAKAVILLVHGLGGHTGRWEPLARYLKGRGIVLYALALRGFGETPGIKGHIDSFRTYVSDIETLVGIIRHEHPHTSIFLLGESLGGLLSFLTAIEKEQLFSGLICLSPAFADTLNIKAGVFWMVILASFLAPAVQFRVPFSLSCCSRDEELVRHLEADPREHRLATARLLVETFAAQQRAKALGRKISIPVLFLLSGHDTIVSTAASMKVFESLTNRDKTVNVYADMYHALSIDRGREAVFRDIYEWIKPRAEGIA